MDKYIDLNIILLSISLVICLVFGIIFIVKNNKQKPTLFLGLFFIVLGLDSMNSLSEISGFLEEHPELLFLPFNFYFLFVPLLFIYAKRLTTAFSIKNQIIHFIPGLIEFVFFSILFFLPTSSKLTIGSSPNMLTFWTIYIIVNLIYSLYYLYKIYLLIKNHEKEVFNFYSRVEGKMLSWMKPVIFFLGIFGIVWMLSNYVYFLSDNESVAYYSSICIHLFNCIFIFWTVIMGLKQVSLLEFVQMKSGFQINTLNPINLSTKKNSQLYQRLLKYIEAETPYVDIELTLSKLASKLKTHPRNISEVINKEARMNFNQFINKYRVGMAKKMLSSNEYNNYSILGIAEKSGFSSKTTFNTAFKQFTSMTPSLFRETYNNDSMDT